MKWPSNRTWSAHGPLDLASRQIEGEVPVGGQPAIVAVSQQFEQAFIGNTSSFIGLEQ
jgi:hypothetical protein